MNRRIFTKIIATSIFAASACNKPEIIFKNKTKPLDAPTFENLNEYITCFPNSITPTPLRVVTYNDIPFQIRGIGVDSNSRAFVSPVAIASHYILFDRHRFSSPLINGAKANIEDAYKKIFSLVDTELSRHKNIAIITNTINSPFLNKICLDIKGTNPQIKILQLPTFDFFRAQLEANIELFNKTIYIVPNIENKKFIINFGSDFLLNDPLFSFYLPRYSKSHHFLITFEDTVSLTGLNSQIRVPATKEKMLKFALGILAYAAKLKNLPNITHQIENTVSDLSDFELPYEVKEMLVNEIEQIAFLCSPYCFPELQAVTTILNNLCRHKRNENCSKQFYTLNLENYYRSIANLDILINNPKEFGLVIFLGYNPFFSLHQSLTKLIKSKLIQNIAYISLYQNELSEYASIYIPAQTFFEYWGDYENIEGEILFQQKILEPINRNSTSEFEFLYKLKNYLIKSSSPADYFSEMLKYYKVDNDEGMSEDYLRKGVLPSKTHQNEIILNLEKINFDNLLSRILQKTKQNFERRINIIPSHISYFGEYSNNVYLREIPEPISGVSWLPLLYLSNTTSTNFNIQEPQETILESNSQKMRLTSYPIKIRETVTDFIIYNNNYYFNKYLNQNFCSISADFVSFEYNYIFDGKIIDFGNKINLPIISRNSYTSSFDILSPLGINDNKDNLQLYGNLTVSQQTQWAMLVDIDKCIGCNLCMLACQIENNIPVVGIENIKKNRDLYWIYIARAEDKVGRSYFIPVMCQHCENAPCESVCPVGATSHSSEGINEMTYNQCIGSRFCMVNCPYSVRKFNFIRPEKIHLNFIPEMMNPFVSVRPRGVSEKCTFCIHRINFEKRRSKLFGLPENLQIKTACEEVCPVGAIKFGKKENLLTNEANQQIFTLLRNFNTKPNVFNKLRSNEEIKS